MTMVTLGALVDRLSTSRFACTLDGDSGLGVVDVHHDSRQVTPRSLFCCVVGAHADGHDHAIRAVEAGAVALVTQRPLNLGVPEIRVDDVRACMGHLAAAVHGDPSRSMRCIGVTGTNGKTTTVALLEAIGRAAGNDVATVGTLTGARTTPEATDLQRDLAGFRDRGCSMVAMEVSSHGLAQQRVAGMRFKAAVFTNLSQDHLDFHGSMEDYFRAKAMLFEPELSECGVVNVDDPHGRLLMDASRIPTVGFTASDGEPVDSVAPLGFTWHGDRVSTRLAGRFNLENALGAATAARALGFGDDAIRSGLAAAAPVPGRFELIDASEGATVVVDFAHTPDGLAKVLAAAREIAGRHRVIVVFGAGGDRDPTKRPAMGAAAEHGADLIIVTTDNARSEDPAAIAAQIRDGMTPGAPVRIELDRRSAIETALGEARRGDVVVIAGKGHETTQTIGDVVTPFDDRVVARELIARQGGHR